jgi:hypothetical protein
MCGFWKYYYCYKARQFLNEVTFLEMSKLCSLIEWAGWKFLGNCRKHAKFQENQRTLAGIWKACSKINLLALNF